MSEPLKDIAERARAIVNRPVTVELRFHRYHGYPLQHSGEDINKVTVHWQIQARTDDGRRIISGYGDTPDEALAGLAKSFAHYQGVPEIARRLADTLREVPDHRWDRDDVIDAAKQILEAERQTRDT